jgi:hypothetical protein
MKIGDKITTKEQADDLPVGTVVLSSSGIAYTKAAPDLDFMHSSTRINYSSRYQWSYISEAPGFQTAERTSGVVGNTIVFLPPIPPKKVGETVRGKEIENLPLGTLLFGYDDNYVVIGSGQIILGNVIGARPVIPSEGFVLTITHIPS